MTNLDTIASRLDEAAVTAMPLAQLAEPLTLDQAYEVQALLLARRYRRGERPIGIKMGFTSRAKMAQMGVRRSDLGPPYGSDAFSRWRHDFPAGLCPSTRRTGDRFSFETPLCPERSMRRPPCPRSPAVAAALEIIDSRYRDFKFSLTDVVADNSSSSALVVGGGWSRRSISATCACSWS